MIGVILFTLGGLNAVMAINVGTCTQGGADGLYGGFLTLFLYLTGLAAFLVRPPTLPALVALIPAGAIAAWHSLFAMRFAWGYWARDMSACYALAGGFTRDEAGEWMDGGEPMLTLLWIGLSLLFWASAAIAAEGVRRRFSASDRAASTGN
jgi:hypothetical protein